MAKEDPLSINDIFIKIKPEIMKKKDRKIFEQVHLFINSLAISLIHPHETVIDALRNSLTISHLLRKSIKHLITKLSQSKSTKESHFAFVNFVKRYPNEYYLKYYMDQLEHYFITGKLNTSVCEKIVNSDNALFHKCQDYFRKES